MNTILNATILVASLTMVVHTACPTGQSEWQDGCVVDIQPEIAKPVEPSDEKPPADKMPSWQREGVTIVNAPSMTDEDTKADQENREANAQGMQRAGIKPK